MKLSVKVGKMEKVVVKNEREEKYSIADASMELEFEAREIDVVMETCLDAFKQELKYEAEVKPQGCARDRRDRENPVIPFETKKVIGVLGTAHGNRFKFKIIFQQDGNQYSIYTNDKEEFIRIINNGNGECDIVDIKDIEQFLYKSKVVVEIYSIEVKIHGRPAQRLMYDLQKSVKTDGVVIEQY